MVKNTLIKIEINARLDEMTGEFLLSIVGMCKSMPGFDVSLKLPYLEPVMIRNNKYGTN